jgi:hypothetical protein
MAAHAVSHAVVLAYCSLAPTQFDMIVLQYASHWEPQMSLPETAAACGQCVVARAAEPPPTPTW